MSDKKPLSDAQLEANRANSKKSTGPRSIEGKLRSRNNSFKHGLTGATALLPSDNRDAYEQYVAGIVDSLHPGSLLEHEICRDVADAHWRLRRIHSVESKMLTLPAQIPAPSKPTPFDHFSNAGRQTYEPIIVVESDEPPFRSREEDLHTAARVCLDSPNSLTNITLFEQRIHRGIKHSMDELRRLQAERQARLQSEMPIAINHYKFHLMQDLPFDPAADGFVFSNDEIDDALYLDLRQKRVEFAAAHDFDLAVYEKRYPKRAA